MSLPGIRHADADGLRTLIVGGGEAGRTLAKALRYGADVIEIDVISARGQLVAGRIQPLPQLARQVFRGPTLAEAWDRAAAALARRNSRGSTASCFRCSCPVRPLARSQLGSPRARVPPNRPASAATARHGRLG